MDGFTCYREIETSSSEIMATFKCVFAFVLSQLIRIYGHKFFENPYINILNSSMFHLTVKYFMAIVQQKNYIFVVKYLLHQCQMDKILS